MNSLLMLQDLNGGSARSIVMSPNYTESTFLCFLHELTFNLCDTELRPPNKQHILPNLPSLAVAQDSHLQRVTIPEAAHVQFASLTS